MKHVRLPAYDASELDRLSYSNGDLVNDTTNATIRYMDGETPGGFKIATEDYVQINAITSTNLADNLATALVPYAKTVDLAPYALTSTVNSQIAGIPIYSLPIAGTSSGSLGGVKVDGTTILINPSTGVISGANQYVLPTATVGTAGTGTLGGVKVDGTTILISNGVISGANQYVLPSATSSTIGGVKVAAVGTSGLLLGTGATAGQLSLPTASTTQLGGVKVDGTSITINGSGVISGSNQYVLPAATTTVLGGVTVPATANSGLTNTSGAIRIATATTNQIGGVKVDGVTITINGSGVISANITGAIVFQGGWDASLNSPTLSNASSAYNTNGFEFVCIAAGTVNFGAGNVTFAVGDNVIYDGVKWVKIPIGSNAGTTNSILTINNSGTGAVSGTTFNGSSDVTISYNSIGASPTAGSSSLTTVGTIGTGTWNGDIIGSAYGGTGVNNSYTLTITGSNRSLDQDVHSGASPSFNGANFTGTAASLSVGDATTASSATSAGKATNLAGGGANQIPYQTLADTTSFITPSGTNTFLSWTGSAYSWSAVSSATTATNLAGGAANRLAVQTGAGATGFVVAPTVTNTYLQWNGTAFVFAAVTGATGGTVTSVSGTGTVSGITLSGTVTGTGNLTLGGTLSLVSPGAIGGTTASTGRFTTITATTQAATTDGGGTIFLNNVSNNRIDFAASAAVAPAFTTRSAGTKIVLWPAVAAASADYAIGIEANTQWFSVPTSSQQFKWYAGTTNIATLSGAGALSAVTFTSTQATGTAPFTVSSTTNVPNLNASSLSGATFASPGAIGSGTASTGAFTTVTATTSIKASGTGGIGYNTGASAGGTVTQLISRTTGVTLDKITGRITLLNAAGDNTQWLSFTVTNSTVAATDTVIVTGDVATNRYIANVSNVAAGSFEITYFSFGTAIDQPTFNFSVIKGSSN